MSSLSTIRNRLRAVENIKQITTSMEMVASARFKKAQEKAKQAQFYIAKMQQILEKMRMAPTDFMHPLFLKRPVKNLGLVIIGSDRGLCGAYNSNLISKAEDYLKDKTAHVELILLGKKIIQKFQLKRWKIFHTLNGWSGKITVSQMREFSTHLVDAFLKGRLDRIELLYTKFHSLMQREVVLETFLPVGQLDKTEKKFNYIFEPGIEALYEEMLPRYCMTKIETVLHQAHASELTARIFSMKAAVKNAEEMMEQLSLERNKMRQANITRELLETMATHE